MIDCNIRAVSGKWLGFLSLPTKQSLMTRSKVFAVVTKHTATCSGFSKRNIDFFKYYCIGDRVTQYDYRLNYRATGFRSPAQANYFFLQPVSKPALRPTQPPIPTGTGVLSPGGKWRPGCDADHSPQSSAYVKKEQELYLLSPCRLHGGAGHLYYYYIKANCCSGENVDKREIKLQESEGSCAARSPVTCTLYQLLLGSSMNDGEMG
jgi:hypothetical protein